MAQFIDVHNHLAWGIDDGMENEEHAQITLQNAQADGVSAIIATPHFVPGQFDQEMSEQAYARIQDLAELAKSYGITVYRGAEMFLNNDYLDMLDDGLCPSMADSKYLLCEFDVRKELTKRSEEVEDKLYEIKVRDYIPIIAHVERYFHKKIDLERVKSWIDMGCVIQINRTSLLGMHGEASQDNALKLLENNMVHLVATDTHRSHGPRTCKMSDAYAFISEHYGERNAQILCYDNPNHIIHDEPLESIKVEKQSFFKRLFGRK